jgi:hypothetical protein
VKCKRCNGKVELGRLIPVCEKCLAPGTHDTEYIEIDLTAAAKEAAAKTEALSTFLRATFKSPMAAYFLLRIATVDFEEDNSRYRQCWDMLIEGLGILQSKKEESQKQKD